MWFHSIKISNSLNYFICLRSYCWSSFFPASIFLSFLVKFYQYVLYLSLSPLFVFNIPLVLFLFHLNVKLWLIMNLIELFLNIEFTLHTNYLVNCLNEIITWVSSILLTLSLLNVGFVAFVNLLSKWYQLHYLVAMNYSIYKISSYFD